MKWNQGLLQVIDGIIAHDKHLDLESWVKQLKFRHIRRQITSCSVREWNMGYDSDGYEKTGYMGEENINKVVEQGIRWIRTNQNWGSYIKV